MYFILYNLTDIMLVEHYHHTTVQYLFTNFDGKVKMFIITFQTKHGLGPFYYTKRLFFTFKSFPVMLIKDACGVVT